MLVGPWNNWHLEDLSSALHLKSLWASLGNFWTVQLPHSALASAVAPTTGAAGGTVLSPQPAALTCGELPFVPRVAVLCQHHQNVGKVLVEFFCPTKDRRR